MTTDKTALVTGSGVRLGKALALALARRGYHIALHYSTSHQPAEATQAEIEALGVQCVLFQQDLADAAALDGLVQRVGSSLPNLAVLVNSASAYASADITTTPLELYDQQMAVNLRAPFFLTQAFAKYATHGNIINIIDNKIHYNQFAYAAYLLAKKALAELTRMAALEFAPAIRVNGIAPGVVLPAESRSADYVAWRVRQIPLQRQGSPDHIAAALFFLLDNDFVTGQILTVDGGEGQTNIGFNFTQYQGD